jgi:hypothetical protein
MLLVSGGAMAWGTEGHHIVAYVAAQHLTPHALQGVESIFGPDGMTEMIQVSTWADEIRLLRPETGPLHFVNIPIRSNGLMFDRDCPDRMCVIAAIEDGAQRVANKSLLPEVRAEALKYLIHFVGDITQPLHCADNHDHGGNAVSVTAKGQRTSLHAFWDNNAVRGIARNEREAAELVNGMADPRYAAGSPAEWAEESWQIAHDFAYSAVQGSGAAYAPIILSEDYQTQAAQIAAVQLARGGIRLAAILNRLFP